MAWTMQEACRLLLAGRARARRVGETFQLDPQKMRYAGFQPSEIAEIERAATAIEQFTEQTLAALRRKL